jgi:hypothetical protein
MFIWNHALDGGLLGKSLLSYPLLLNKILAEIIL